MNSFGALRRKIRFFTGMKNRNGLSKHDRPAKLRKLRHDVEEELQNAASPSDISQPSPIDSFEDDASPDRYAAAVNTETTGDVQSASEESTTFVGDSDSTALETAIRKDLSYGNAVIEVAEPSEDTQDASEPHTEAVPAPSEQDLVDEQLLREQLCVEYEGEDETDYTAGPARLVMANDGVKSECVALLMTLPLSGAMQEVIRLQHQFARVEHRALRQRQALGRLDRKIKTQITSYKHRIKLESAKDGDAAVVASLAQEVGILDMMVEDVGSRRQRATNDVEWHAEILRQACAAAFEHIEGAFLKAKLIEQEPAHENTPHQELDLQQEYADFCETLRTQNDEVPIPAAPLDTGIEHLMAHRAPLTPEEEHLENLKTAFWESQQRLRLAQISFDRREYDAMQAWQATIDAAGRGEEVPDATVEDFDLRMLKHYQDLTRELIEAEAALAEAKAAALGAGLPVGQEDAASGFLDDVEDGYRVSFEAELAESVPAEKLDGWLSGIPDVASPNERTHAEVDEWETQTVGISDSISCVAQEVERRRIDKWRSGCGYEGR